jgi:hypothetical protein
MAALTDYAENLILDWLLTAGAATRPSAWYVALHTAAPSDSNPSNGELSGDGYARQSVTFSAASSGATANTADLDFGPASGNWGEITHFSVWSASSGGNALLHGALSAPVTINTNDSFKVPAGDLDVTAA